jgi:hypothetical protein
VTRAQLDQLIERIAAGIRVLRTRDGVALSEDQIYERARNIAACVSLNYEMEPLDGDHREAA